MKTEYCNEVSRIQHLQPLSLGIARSSKVWVDNVEVARELALGVCVLMSGRRGVPPEGDTMVHGTISLKMMGKN